PGRSRAPGRPPRGAPGTLSRPGRRPGPPRRGAADEPLRPGGELRGRVRPGGGEAPRRLPGRVPGDQLRRAAHDRRAPRAVGRRPGAGGVRSPERGLRTPGGFVERPRAGPGRFGFVRWARGAERGAALDRGRITAARGILSLRRPRQVSLAFWSARS